MTGESVTASIHIQAPPERVYEYFTRPQAMVTWMGEYALLEAEPGGRFCLDIKGAPVRGRYLHLDPPHRLLISWGYAGSDHLPPKASTVEVTLTAEGDGTRVHLEHRDLPPAEQRRHASGWTHYLARLQLAAPGHDPGPDSGMPDSCPAGSPQPGVATANANPEITQRDPPGQRVRRQVDVQAGEVVGELLSGPRAEDRDDAAPGRVARRVLRRRS